MLSVLLLFLIPIGGGIPAGVLMAQSKGLGWGVTAGLYLVSDLILACLFEPVLRLLVLLGRRSPFMVRLGEAMQASMRQSAAPYLGRGSGPLACLLVAFCADPMTGRAAALAAGHGPVLGWAIAIAGDLFYYAVVAMTTLKLQTWVRHPEATVALVLVGMAVLPTLVRQGFARVRARMA